MKESVAAGSQRYTEFKYATCLLEKKKWRNAISWKGEEKQKIGEEKKAANDYYLSISCKHY